MDSGNNEIDNYILSNNLSNYQIIKRLDSRNQLITQSTNQTMVNRRTSHGRRFCGQIIKQSIIKAMKEW